MVGRYAILFCLIFACVFRDVEWENEIVLGRQTHQLSSTKSGSSPAFPLQTPRTTP